MSRFVGNPEDRFSRVEAHMRIKSRKPVSCSRIIQELCLAEFLPFSFFPFRIFLKNRLNRLVKALKSSREHKTVQSKYVQARCT